jgi:hypothetical protein
MYHPFSIIETLKLSGTILKKNFATLFVYSLISLFVYGFLNIVSFILVANDGLTNEIILFFFQILIQSYLTLSFYKLVLTLMDKAYYEFEFKEIIPSFKMAFNFIVVILLYTILVATLFFINTYFLARYEKFVPICQALEMILLLFLLVRSIFCVCFIVDEDSKPIESLKQSFDATKGNFFNTLFIGLIILVIMVLTLVPFISILSLLGPTKGNIDVLIKISFYLWFVIAFPTVQVIIMVTYRKLVYSHLDVDDDDAAESL